MCVKELVTLIDAFRDYENEPKKHRAKIVLREVLRFLYIYIYIYIYTHTHTHTEWPKKCIHSLLINIFGINVNEMSLGVHT